MKKIKNIFKGFGLLVDLFFVLETVEFQRRGLVLGPRCYAFFGCKTHPSDTFLCLGVSWFLLPSSDKHI